MLNVLNVLNVHHGMAITAIGPIFTIPIGGTMRLYLDMTAPSARNQTHNITIDANFHVDNLGTVISSGAGSPAGLVTVDMAAYALAPGWHKLVVVHSGVDSISKAVHSGMAVLLCFQPPTHAVTCRHSGGRPDF